MSNKTANPKPASKKKPVNKKNKPAHKGGSGQPGAHARRKLFAEAYLSNNNNITVAAKIAGFSEKTAHSQGSRLLKHVEVQQIIRERQQALQEKHELTTDAILSELAKLVYSDPRKMFDAKGGLLPPEQWPDDMAGAISSVEVEELFDGQGKQRKHIGYTKKIKLWDKNPAIDKAARILGMFKEDNNQKSLLGDLPRETIKAIQERLRGLPGR